MTSKSGSVYKKAGILFAMETPELTCPACGSSHRQTKEGKTAFGSQRFQCQDCKRYYTPTPKPHGYSAERRQFALRLYLEGTNFRRIGRLLEVAPQTVINWVNAYKAALQKQGTTPPQPATVETAELDELWTFIGSKKNGVIL